MNTDNLIIAAMSFLVSGMNFQRFNEKKRAISLFFGVAYAVVGILYAALTFRRDAKPEQESKKSH